MTIDQLIALITSIATFITSIIVLLTLFEMQKQRKSAYKPEIVLKTPVKFHIYLEECENVYLPFIWSSNELKKINLNELNFSIYIDAFNIGLGSAKSIEVMWDFELDKILKRIKNKDTENFFDIEYNDSMLRITFQGIAMIMNMENNCHWRYDYILPSQSKQGSLKFELPRPFLDLFSIILYLEYFKKDTLNFDFPNLKLKLKYEDIGNNIYKKEFNLNFDFIKFNKVLNPKEYELKFNKPIEMCLGIIEIKEIKSFVNLKKIYIKNILKV